MGTAKGCASALGDTAGSSADADAVMTSAVTASSDATSSISVPASFYSDFCLFLQAVNKTAAAMIIMITNMIRLVLRVYFISPILPILSYVGVRCYLFFRYRYNKTSILPILVTPKHRNFLHHAFH